MKAVKGYVGLVDGEMYFSHQRDGNYSKTFSRLAQVFSDRRDCERCCKNCVEVLIAEKPKKERP